MGRNAVVTYEAVKAAAASLAAKGIAATAGTVRRELGDEGGNGTIQKFLTQLKQEEEQAPVAERIVPHKIGRAIFQYVDEQVARIHGDLKADVEQSRQAVIELSRDNEKLTDQLADKQAENDAMALQVASLKGQIQQLEAELDRAHREATAARAEAEQARAKVATAEWQLKAAELELENTSIKYRMQVITGEAKPEGSRPQAPPVDGKQPATAVEDPRQRRLCD